MIGEYIFGDVLVGTDGKFQEQHFDILHQPWAKCGLFAAVALLPIFCGLIAAFSVINFAIRVCNTLVNIFQRMIIFLLAHTVTLSDR